MLHPDGVGCAPVHSRVRRDEHTATLIARARIRLEPAGTAAWCREMTTTLGDVLYEDDDEGLHPPRYEGDYTPFKHAGDALLVGHFHAPGGRPVERSRVAFGVGSRDLKLAVSGPRVWNLGLLGATASEPDRFDRLPLRWDQAFGGPEYDANPVGRGHVTKAAKKSGEPIELPRIEWPDQLVGSPKDTPDPAGFGPRSRTTGERLELLGTFDDDWVANRWPLYPKDFDLRHFQAAVPALQFADYLAGDETLWFENLHPEHREYETRLPGLAAVAGVRRAGADGGRIEVVAMNLDTLWVDMDAEEAVLVWRGLTDTADPELTDLEYVCFDLLESGVDRSERAVADRVRAAIVADEETWAIEEEEPPEDDEAADGDAPAEEAAADEPEVPLFQQDPELFAPFAKAGIDPDAPPPELDEAQQKTFDELLSKAEPVPEPEEEPDPEDPPWDRERLRAALADGTLEAGEDLSGIDLEGENLAGADLSGRILSRARLAGANLSGANLRDAVLDGADLSGADLTGVALAAADLTSATAPGAKAARCDLSESNLAGSNWEGADLSEAKLDGADAPDAKFGRAILRSASLVETVLERANLDEADLSGATATDASFVEATVSRARCGGGRFGGADFSAAALAGTSFDGADLTDATFEGAKAAKTSFVAAKIGGMRAAGPTDFSDSCFDRAEGPDPIFTGARISGATFRDATIPGSDFTETSAAGAEFVESVLKGARFARADLEGANVVRCDCFEASFAGARLDDVDGSGSSFYAAEFLDAETETFHGRGRTFAMSKLADRPDERGRR